MTPTMTEALRRNVELTRWVGRATVAVPPAPCPAVAPAVRRRGWRPAARTRATLALAGTALLWGTSFVATKPVLAHVPPLTLTFLRTVVALVVLLPLVRRAGRRPDLGPASALLGLTGVALAVACQNLGLRETTATDAALILNGGIPVLTVALAVLWLREPVGRRALAGAVCSLAGVAALVLFGQLGGAGTGVSTLGGELLLAAGAAAFAVYTVLGRRVVGGRPSLPVVAGGFAYGTAVLLPGAAGELATVGLGRPPLPALLAVVYLGAACSALALVLQGYALARLEANRVATVLNLELGIGVAAAMLLVHEPITPGRVAGGVLIAAGVVLAGGDRTASDDHGRTGAEPRRQRLTGAGPA